MLAKHFNQNTEGVAAKIYDEVPATEMKVVKIDQRKYSGLIRATKRPYSYVNKFGEYHIKEDGRCIAISENEDDACLIVDALNFARDQEFF